MKNLLLLLLLGSSSAHATLYGGDTRQMVRTFHPAYQSSRAVAVMVAETALLPSTKSKDLIDIETDTLQNNQFMCSTERFSKEQGLYVSCTGFLVAPDILITAGHCAINHGEEKNSASAYCSDFKWYFDFELNALGKIKNKDVKKDSIYSCKEIIHVAHISTAPTPTQINFDSDFAIIKLDRPVLNRPTLKLTSERPKKGERITMIGHPLGAAKTSTVGKLLSNEPMFDRAAISGFEGNSGSPVFNSRGEVFGILVRGYPEGLIDSKTQRDCRVVNRCDINAENCTERDEQIPGDHIMPIGLIDTLKDLNLVK